ncbi:hypothetical protein [Pseudomonas sp. 5P_3.1_Bac2]|uniref:hypothetical protein n=1 Tax=Pseudomonas sp. 5P_3.1_Bac2 TaxID=2971617 RepID=UPI0021C5B8B1|nr:hypothetical protein [Pseudomonas sp. 5P_3.1_Bac2]MCU1718670.1 hypothetical protein [Pseudomonas sp. 5P_3.1_Bac2]
MAFSRVASAAAAPAAPAIHFNPVIQLKGDAEAGAQVKQALQLSYADFERLMQRYQNGQARRGYGDIG